jgi:hypothetical protein
MSMRSGKVGDFGGCADGDLSQFFDLVAGAGQGLPLAIRDAVLTTRRTATKPLFGDELTGAAKFSWKIL